MANQKRKLDIVVAVRDQTRRALKATQDRIRRFSKKTAQLLSSAFKVGLAAAGVALAAYVQQVKKQLTEIDQLAKDAFRFGVAIENIKGLELAANLAGLSLAEMGTILRDTARRVSEAAQGTGEAQDALKELGLDAGQLNMMPVAQQLDAILGRLEAVDNQNDRIRLSYDIMGRSGVKGLTLIGTSIRGAIFETKQLGAAINNDLKKNVEDTNDAVTRLGVAWDGLMINTLPSLTDLVDSLRRFTSELRFIKDHALPSIELFFLRMIDTADATLQIFRDAIKFFSSAASRFEDLAIIPAFQVGAALDDLVRQSEIASNIIDTRIQTLLQRMNDATKMAGDVAIEKSNEFFNHVKRRFKEIQKLADKVQVSANPPMLSALEEQRQGQPDRDISDMFQKITVGTAAFVEEAVKEQIQRFARIRGGPGIAEGRLLTGSSQSSAEQLAAIAREADRKRQEEAKRAEQQRQRMLETFQRILVLTNGRAGTLLQ